MVSFAAVAESLAAADRYHTWDAWSLNHPCVLWEMELLAEHRVRRMIECGAGYSTVALAEFARQTGLEVTIDTIEHYPPFAADISPVLDDYPNVRLHVPELRQVTVGTLDELVLADQPHADFVARSEPVPPERLLEHLEGLFYAIDPTAWEPESVDLLVVDGPNSSGRALAPAFFAPALRVPGWVLIDDYLHRPFLYHLGRLFDFEVVRRLDGVKPYGSVLTYLTARL